MKPLTLLPAAAGGGAAGTRRDATPAPWGEAEPVLWPRTSQHRVRSAEGRSYLIKVALPAEPAPPGGFPVIYALDANATFGTMVEALRLQSRRPGVTGVGPAVVVGIGYDTQEPFDVARRTYDMTPTRHASAPSGGAGEFLAFLVDELAPQIERRFPADPGRRGLFGHSLGGLFALYALFTMPGAFAAIVAASPSLWWGEGSLADVERRFLGNASRLSTRVRVLLGVGLLEEPDDPAAAPDHRSGKRMVSRARELADRLASTGNPNLRVDFVGFPDENHASVVPAAISRAVRFLAAVTP